MCTGMPKNTQSDDTELCKVANVYNVAQVGYHQAVQCTSELCAHSQLASPVLHGGHGIGLQLLVLPSGQGHMHHPCHVTGRHLLEPTSEFNAPKDETGLDISQSPRHRVSTVYGHRVSTVYADGCSVEANRVVTKTVKLHAPHLRSTQGCPPRPPRTGSRRWGSTWCRRRVGPRSRRKRNKV